MTDNEPDITFTVTGSREEFGANLVKALTTYTTVLADAWDEGEKAGRWNHADEYYAIPTPELNPYRVVKP